VLRRQVVALGGIVILLSGVLAGCHPAQSHVSTVTVESGLDTNDTLLNSFPLPTATLAAAPTSVLAPAMSIPTAATTATSTTTPARTYASPPIVVPANYRQTFTHYATVDRADGDGAVRVLYITSAAIPVFQKTGVFPDGTMVIMEIYQPHTAADGSIQHDPSGHFVPGSLHSVLVKLKVGTASTPVSTAVAPTVNQRGWVYAAFDATTGTVDGFNQPLCQSCHLRAQAWDDLFTRPELLAFAQTVEPQYLLCQLSGKQPCEEPESK